MPWVHIPNIGSEKHFCKRSMRTSSSYSCLSLYMQSHLLPGSRVFVYRWVLTPQKRFLFNHTTCDFTGAILRNPVFLPENHIRAARRFQRRHKQDSTPSEKIQCDLTGGSQSRFSIHVLCVSNFQRVLGSITTTTLCGSRGPTKSR